MWVNVDGLMYAGDCQPGDREATTEEIVAFEAMRDKTTRLAEIDARLAEIDADSGRPSREISLALLDGRPADAYAASKLAALEKEASALRAERKGLTS